MPLVKIWSHEFVNKLDSAVTTGKHRAQEIDRDTTLQTSQNKETDRIPFTLSYHPQNLAIKNVILKNFKILHKDPENKHIFSLPPLISFKRDKNLGNFLVRSAFKLNNQPGTFTNTMQNLSLYFTVKISGPNRSVKVTDHFTCISTNVIYCITCTLCKKIYIRETAQTPFFVTKPLIAISISTNLLRFVFAVYHSVSYPFPSQL